MYTFTAYIMLGITFVPSPYIQDYFGSRNIETFYSVTMVRATLACKSVEGATPLVWISNHRGGGGALLPDQPGSLFFTGDKRPGKVSHNVRSLKVVAKITSRLSSG